jgi:hypothetical protein
MLRFTGIWISLCIHNYHICARAVSDPELAAVQYVIITYENKAKVLSAKGKN